MATYNPHTKHPFHKRMPLRWDGYDYMTAADYFITIVCHERRNMFGEIYNGVMKLNDAGKMVADKLDELTKKFPDTEMVQMVVMPNHIHFVLGKYESECSVSTIIDWLKSDTTDEYIKGVKTKQWPRFRYHLWQRNYYDHIVRNQRALDYICQYIYENPARWFADHINPECTHPEEIMRTIKDLECGSPPPGKG